MCKVLYDVSQNVRNGSVKYNSNFYGGYWPLDFGSLESDDYTATKICIAKVYNIFHIKVSD